MVEQAGILTMESSRILVLCACVLLSAHRVADAAGPTAALPGDAQATAPTTAMPVTPGKNWSVAMPSPINLSNFCPNGSIPADELNRRANCAGLRADAQAGNRDRSEISPATPGSSGQYQRRAAADRPGAIIPRPAIVWRGTISAQHRQRHRQYKLLQSRRSVPAIDWNKSQPAFK